MFFTDYKSFTCKCDIYFQWRGKIISYSTIGFLPGLALLGMLTMARTQEIWNFIKKCRTAFGLRFINFKNILKLEMTEG